MNRYASALSRHPVPAHAVGETAGELLEQLGAEDPDLLVCFLSPHFVGALDDMVHAIQNLLEPGVLLAVSTSAVVGDSSEVEDGPALALFAACLPEVSLTPVELHVEETADGAIVVGWPDLERATGTLVLLADPFTFPVDTFLRRCNDDHPDLTVIGGLASAATRPGGNRLALDERVVLEGAVGVLIDGVELDTVVSQGVRPVGQPLVVTRSDGRFLQELAGRPALDRLREVAADAGEEDRALLQAGLHLGVVVDEHRSEFGRGDFLVRTVIGADRETGAVAVGDHLEVGQTVQFQVRDAAAADEDLRALLLRSAPLRGGGALLFTCTGRGQHLFGVADHDAGLVQEVLGPLALAGGFCAGEIGPVGGTSFLHGFTASLVVFPPTVPAGAPGTLDTTAAAEAAGPGPAHAS